ncbi:ImmA/IrrE family metallo-endopeptidase [Pseudomonas sp. ER28]|uniref:ImmA/IrrE family metallo-endopeptidase n=1 Tax=Pseudomonas sp. ER28 TaxID=3033801 RepID=UPI0023E00C8C|nr:ImmA/IrrE family metallo-endopeptidase [Pseudomonas sp. ER28]MDF3172078.1 ImmA/IrrE family metallo-endopeptidase [Pseudomonas sp. ER28]
MITLSPKIIKTEEQYLEYFNEVHSLIISSPKLGSEESDRLELLSMLIEDYEKQKYPVEAPDPIDAILFRMTEKGLKQADLVPYFGTRSRVSEVLARKRPLTVPMIRALAVGLGISADTLIGLDEVEGNNKKQNVDWSKFPIKEMVARGWIDNITSKAKKTVEEIVQGFISDMGLQESGASFRRTLAGDSPTPTTTYALYAWLARVIQRTREIKSELPPYDRAKIGDSLIKQIVHLSRFEDGPKMAVSLLNDHGIAVIIEPQLKGTMLDGAALKEIDGTPIIALTLRYDRIDNFWFTLVHELVHVWKHIEDTNEAILDDLEHASTDKRESEANRIARDAFIPRSLWKRTDAYLKPSKETINALAKELNIHPAIVAGRLRKEAGNYNQFTDLIGQGMVRAQLENL